jgi:hypothetical protein
MERRLRCLQVGAASLWALLAFSLGAMAASGTNKRILWDAPASRPANTYPVYCVSWNDIAAPGGFIEKLNLYLGTTKFHLPSEAQWEYAAPSGGATLVLPRPWGQVTQAGAPFQLAALVGSKYGLDSPIAIVRRGYQPGKSYAVNQLRDPRPPHRRGNSGIFASPHARFASNFSR